MAGSLEIEEINPLVDEGSNAKKGKPKGKNPLYVFIMIIIVVAAVSKGSASFSMSERTNGKPRNGEAEVESLTDPLTISSRDLPRLITPEHAKVEVLRDHFQKARSAAEDFLKEQYGSEAFAKIFKTDSGDSAGRIFYTSQYSGARLRQRFLQKLLHVVSSAKSSSSASPSSAIPFIWATGGHSAAAGHGNLFEESYTRYMEKLLEPVLTSIGVSVEARNYAMGGTSSAAEIALCSREIFGDDLDILTWDYGMTDGRGYEKMDLYFQRSALETNGRASFLGIHVEGRTGGGRQSVMKSLDEQGLTALYMDPNQQKRMTENIPDTFGKSEEEIEKMHPVVKYLKCGTKLENGDPGCGPHKFNNSVCPNRRAKTSWHPGWKYHSLIGHMNAIFIIDIFEDALSDLAAETNRDTTEWLGTIQNEFDENYNRFLSSKPPESALGLFQKNQNDGEAIADLSVDKLFRNKDKYCQTARLPAESRYHGIVSDREPFQLNAAMKSIAPTDEMRLVMDDNERDHCEIPAEKVQIDYKDFFFANGADGWKSLVVPNEREVEAYGDKHLTRGTVLLCFAGCSWGKCPKGMIHLDNWQNTSEFMVNDVPVTNMTTFQDCQFLKHATGHHFDAVDGRFNLSARAKDASSYFKISSFIAFGE